MRSFDVLFPSSRLSPSHLFQSTQGVVEVIGPFETLPWAEFWSSGKRQPYLIRNAFDPDDDATYDSWPTFDDIFLELSTTDHTRLIHHSPGNLSSFEVETGPLEEAAEDLVKPIESSNRQWTILVNDVDRYVPELADWIDSYFAPWLPRWRRDDAQMSIAKTGGGIGPHVDNYDVFLVQTSGKRQWKVSNELLSALNETDLLIPNLPVSILNVTQFDEASKTLTEVLLHPGDCLYLPPRVIHWGTAASDDCVTLSIGCRAPSAADLLTRASEHVITQGALHPTAVFRYNDARSESKGDSATLSMTTKEEMKLMARQALDAVLDDDDLWDTIVGRLTTEPLRYASASEILVPYNDENNEYRERWGATAQAAFDNVRAAGAAAALIRNPGISLATSTLHGALLPPRTDDDSLPLPPPRLDRLWVGGQMWELPDCCEAASVFRTIERGDLLDGDTIQGVPERLQSLLCTLLSEGVLQVCDLLDPSEDDENDEYKASALEP